MSRITLAVTIWVVLARTPAPCSAELFSVAVPDIEGFYGGITGLGHQSEFDFGQDFIVINEAWLHVVGLSEVFTGGASALQFVGRLDSSSGPSLELPAAVEFDVNVPLTPTGTVLDGNGTVHLTINVLQCCDLGALVTGATLWFDAGSIPSCGDGLVDPGEDCEGGTGCTDCVCDSGFEPTVPPSLDCQPTCGNGTVDPGEDCDGSAGTCPGGAACQSDCTCPPLPPINGQCCFPDGRCENTTQAQCISQEGGFGGADTSCEGDNDVNGIDDACEGVPVASAWGMMILVLALLTGIAIKFGRRHPKRA